MKLQVKMNNSQGINSVTRFNLLSNSEIGKSFLIKFEYSPPTGSVIVEYEIKKTVWDSKEKDFCIDLMMFDRSNGYFYLYPQANEVYIPLIDARKYFNILVKEVFGIEIEISKKRLDRLFQTLKLTNKKEERIEYIKECIENSNQFESGSILGKLLNRDLGKESISNISESSCRLFEYKFTQNLINFAEIVNSIISGIELERIQEGLFSSNILIHKNLNNFFKSELWKKLKNIFGSYDKEFISSGCISGLIPELSTNTLFLPVVQNYLNLELLDLEELDKRYFELSNQTKIDNYYRDYCIKENNSNIFDSIIKVLNLVELLPGYEFSIIQTIPNLTPEELKELRFMDYFNYKNNQLLTLAEFNKVKKFYSDFNNLAEEDLNKILDNKVLKDDSVDSNLYILPRKIPDLMTIIFNKYFV